MTLSDDLITSSNAARLLEASNADLSDLADRLELENEGLREKLLKYEPLAVPLVAGLLSRGSRDARLSGWNPEVAWSTVEPRAGEYDFTAIETALALDPRMRLRLTAGIHAPDHVKALAGGPVSVVGAQPPNARGTIARYWTDPVQARYAALQEAAAPVFDGRLPANFLTGASVIYAEPFLHQIANAETLTNLKAAGWTIDLDKNAQYAMMEAHRVWKRTRPAIAANAYQTIDAQGRVGVDLDWTETWLGLYRSAFGPTAIMGNNSIREEYIGLDEVAGTFYNLLARVDLPLYFQTATWDRISVKGAAASLAERHDALLAVFEWAERLGAHAVEIPGGHNLTTAEIADHDGRLKANNNS